MNEGLTAGGGVCERLTQFRVVQHIEERIGTRRNYIGYSSGGSGPPPVFW